MLSYLELVKIGTLLEKKKRRRKDFFFGPWPTIRKAPFTKIES